MIHDQFALLPTAGVAVQHRLQPCAIVALLRRPQHVGPPEEVPLQHRGAQDGARAPPGLMQRPRPSATALLAAPHQHLIALVWFLPFGHTGNRRIAPPHQFQSLNYVFNSFHFTQPCAKFLEKAQCLTFTTLKLYHCGCLWWLKKNKWIYLCVDSCNIKCPLFWMFVETYT